MVVPTMVADGDAMGVAETWLLLRGLGLLGMQAEPHAEQRHGNSTCMQTTKAENMTNTYEPVERISCAPTWTTVWKQCTFGLHPARGELEKHFWCRVVGRILVWWCCHVFTHLMTWCPVIDPQYDPLSSSPEGMEVLNQGNIFTSR
jgi:hypothetical protein